MGSEAFGADGSLGRIIGEDGTFGVLSDLIGWVSDFVSAAGYFAGGDFQEALGKGFMA
ncbi:hypothetical protein [Dietzia cercidiphylli]|uniref:Uncharacterized protein n=1 Tax=Dietzia cercidiphylli TaxID=498199 RepID=A0ABN2J337_9ACTN|nr:hypothetical protein [Dietzia cercidiphylli]MBB1048834.1 hypothetical protein [Dietzia cercidiphylli]